MAIRLYGGRQAIPKLPKTVNVLDKEKGSDTYKRKLEEWLKGIMQGHSGGVWKQSPAKTKPAEGAQNMMEGSGLTNKTECLKQWKVIRGFHAVFFLSSSVPGKLHSCFVPYSDPLVNQSASGPRICHPYPVTCSWDLGWLMVNEKLLSKRKYVQRHKFKIQSL